MTLIETLDQTDKKIIELLQKNPNTPYSDLANSTNKSQPAVGARITKLNRIGFFSNKYGVNFRTAQIPLFICDIESNDPDKMYQRSKNCPFILNVLNRPGQNNITLLIAATSQEKYFDIIDPCLRQDKSILHINSLPVIKMKEDLIFPFNFNIELYEKLNCSFECPFKIKKEIPLNMKNPISIISLLSKNDGIRPFFEKVIETLLNFTNCTGAGIRYIHSVSKMPFYISKGLSESILKHDEINSQEECICDLIINNYKNDKIFTNYGSFIVHDANNINIQFPTIKHNLTQSPLFRENYKSFALIPIKSNDFVIGLIYITSNQENSFANEIIEKIESTASLIGTALMKVEFTI